MKHTERNEEVKEGNKVKIECGVCWGEGKIEYDDYGNERKCEFCNGKGFIFKSLKTNNQHE